MRIKIPRARGLAATCTETVMGKMKAKKRKKNCHPQLSGVLSVKEPVKQQGLEQASPRSSMPVLEKIKDSSESERQWACHSLVHLTKERVNRDKLVRCGVVKKVTPLLMDQSLPVREAAAGLLRNLSVIEEPILSQQVNHLDIAEHLSAMLIDCLSQYWSSGTKEDEKTSSMEVVENDGMKGDEEDGRVNKVTRIKPSVKHKTLRIANGSVEKEQLTDLLCQGFYLLKNISERNPDIVQFFNQKVDILLPGILQFLVLPTDTMDIAEAVAQLLLTLMEDNSTLIEHLVTSAGCMSLLKGILTISDSNGTGEQLPIRASTAGILNQVLPHVKNSAEHSCILDLILHTHMAILDTDITLAPEQLESMLSVIRAKQVTMEIVANMVYIEEDETEDVPHDEESGVHEDCESMEVKSSAIGSQVMPSLPVLMSVADCSIHEKVWRNVGLIVGDKGFLSYPQSSSGEDAGEMKQEFNQSLASLLTCSLLALKNLVSALPVERWGEPSNLVSMLSSMFTLLERLADPSGVSSLLVTLVHKLIQANILSVTVEEVQMAAKLGLMADSPSVRSDMILLLSQIGKNQLSSSSTVDLQILPVVGSLLKDCVSQDSSLWVVCQALDSIFDLVGDDNFPLQLFMSLSLLSVLESCKSTFKARYQVERKLLEPHRELVQSVTTNLPRFIDYMKLRTAKS